MGLCSSIKTVPGDVLEDNFDRKDSSASAFRSHLVQIDRKHDINTVYDLDNGRVMGTGATSTVKTVRHRTTGVEYALKSIRLNRMDKSKRNMLLREVNLMRQMDHPYIVKIVATYMDFQVYTLLWNCVLAVNYLICYTNNPIVNFQNLIVHH